MKSASGRTGEKGCIFHHTMEMKQPYSMTVPQPKVDALKKKAVLQKMVDTFSLKFQRDNRQNALAVDSAEGKNGEKGCIFHRTVEMKQPHIIIQEGCIIRKWLMPCFLKFQRNNQQPDSCMESASEKVGEKGRIPIILWM